MFISTKPHYS